MTNEQTAEPVKNPCISVCLIEDGVCTGCGMTEDEVNKWPKMTEVERRKVVERLEAAKK